jgi:hypothetical protein
LERVERQIAEVMTAYRAGELSAAIAFPNVSELEKQSQNWWSVGVPGLRLTPVFRA